jgi:hypothetical protein
VEVDLAGAKMAADFNGAGLSADNIETL